MDDDGMPDYSIAHWRDVSGYYYGNGIACRGSPTLYNVNGDALYAIPFLESDVRHVVDEIAFNVWTAHSGTARLGLYMETGSAQPYPGALITDAGTVDLLPGTGLRSVSTVSSLKGENRCLWLVALFDAPSSRATLIATAATDGWSPWPSSGGDGISQLKFSVIASYAGTSVLPSTFPASGSFDNDGPLLVLKYSQ